MDVIRDIRYAARTLLSAPGFAAVAVLTLALGIGANTAIFSVVNAVLLRPPAEVASPERIVYLFTSDFSGPPFGASSYPDVEDFRGASDVFSALAAVTPLDVTAGIDEVRERVRAELVDAEYFEVFGVRPVAGRLFQRADGGPGGAPLVVMSERLWRRSYGGDPFIVGGTIAIDGMPYTVAGIAPAGFEGVERGSATQLWLPLRGAGSPLPADMLRERGSRGLLVVARMRVGVSHEQAQQRMSTLAASLHGTWPDAWTDIQGVSRRITVMPESETRVPPRQLGTVRGFAALLLVVVGLVLLLCCANIANLLLARATGRRREIAVRVAIGAGRGRLVRQLLTESVLLAFAGGALGVLVAVWATDLLSSLLPATVSFDFTPDIRVLGYALLLTIACGLLFGVTPALQSMRTDVIAALRGEAPPAGRKWSVRDALVVVQVAISIVLLMGAGLFLRSLQEASRIDPGFDPERVLVMQWELPGRDVGDAERRAFEDALRERVAALPGVEGVTFASRIPIAQPYGRRSVDVVGYEPAPGEEMEFPFNVVGPDYIELLRVPLANGRSFTEADREGAPPVIIVNETFARRFWPDGGVGRQVVVGGVTREVIGVARDGKYWSLGEAPRPYYYLPRLQESAQTALHVKTAGAPMELAAAVREAARAIDPDVAVLEVRAMEDAMATSLMPQRVAGTLLSAFGALALILASAGLYGVMAYAVGRRIPEFGLRIALGARPGEVMRLVLGRAFALTVTGIVAGVLLAVSAGRLARALLFEVAPTDAAALTVCIVLLLFVGALASWAPALRATRSDPMRALRAE